MARDEGIAVSGHILQREHKCSGIPCAHNAYSYGTASEYINRYIVNFSNMLKPPVDNESVELFNGRDA